MNNQVAKRLMDYLLEKGSSFSLTEYLSNRCERNQKISEIILKNIDLEPFLHNSSKLINDLYNKYKESKEIYRIYLEYQLFIEMQQMEELNNQDSNNEYLKEYVRKEIIQLQTSLDHLNNKNNIICNKKEIFKVVVDWEIYYKQKSNFISKYSDKIIKKLNEINNFGEYKGKHIVHAVIYVFVLDEEMKNVILSNSNPFCWKFPNFLEDLNIYDKEKTLLSTISHEEICDIYCESEEEYEYFKSIGIEFYENSYIQEQIVKTDNYLYEEIKEE